jgi:nucleoside-triphosphatase THEP1
MDRHLNTSEHENNVKRQISLPIAERAYMPADEDQHDTIIDKMTSMEHKTKFMATHIEKAAASTVNLIEAVGVLKRKHDADIVGLKTKHEADILELKNEISELKKSLTRE